MKCKNAKCDLESMHRGRCQRLTHAINAGPVRLTEMPHGKCDEGVALPKGGVEALVDAVQGKTPNRRDRKAYNEYMREYMKRYRAKRAGGVLETPEAESGGRV